MNRKKKSENRSFGTYNEASNSKLVNCNLKSYDKKLSIGEEILLYKK